MRATISDYVQVFCALCEGDEKERADIAVQVIRRFEAALVVAHPGPSQKSIGLTYESRDAKQAQAEAAEQKASSVEDFLRRSGIIGGP